MRGKGSPRGGKGVRSPGGGRDDVTSPRRGGTGERKESERGVPGKVEEAKNDPGAESVGNGVVASKSIPIDDVVMEVKSSLSAKLDTATILKDLEDKRRQQANNVEESVNGGTGGVGASGGVVRGEMKGFKKPAKRGSKERTVTGDDVGEEDDTEGIDDWRDDIKSQGREKAKGKDRKERLTSKRSKEEEERLGSAAVVAGAVVTAEREADNGKESEVSAARNGVNEVSRKAQAKESKMSAEAVSGGEHDDDDGRGGATEMECEVGGAGRQGEGSPKRMLGPGDRTRDPAGGLSDTRGVTGDAVGGTGELSNEKAKMERKLVMLGGRLVVVTEEVTKKTEEKSVSEVGGDESPVVKVMEGPEVPEKDPTDGNRGGEADEGMKDTDGEKKAGRVTGDLSEGDEERDRRSRKKSREGDEEEREKRRRKKSCEVGDGDEEGERHRERRRRHQRKHRHEDDAEKGEDEDEEKEDAEQRRERRRHKKKHRKDESEKRDKKRRKHRHHRRKRSPSESPELSPSDGEKVKRGEEEDGSSKHKQQRRRQVRSTSAEAEKGAVESDGGVARKRSSSRQKKKRRDPSKSPSESPSSSE